MGEKETFVFVCVDVCERSRKLVESQGYNKVIPLIKVIIVTTIVLGFGFKHSDDILGARMLWKPKEARILKNFIDQPV